LGHPRYHHRLEYNSCNFHGLGNNSRDFHGLGNNSRNRRRLENSPCHFDLYCLWHDAGDFNLLWLTATAGKGCQCQHQHGAQ
jgi:hypothetical protein